MLQKQVQVSYVFLKVGNLVSFCNYIFENQNLQNSQTMITKDKVIEIFCIIDEFDKNLNVELSKNLCLPSITAMVNVAEIVREDFLKVKS